MLHAITAGTSCTTTMAASDQAQHAQSDMQAAVADTLQHLCNVHAAVLSAPAASAPSPDPRLALSTPSCAAGKLVAPDCLRATLLAFAHSWLAPNLVSTLRAWEASGQVGHTDTRPDGPGPTALCQALSCLLGIGYQNEGQGLLDNSQCPGAPLADCLLCKLVVCRLLHIERYVKYVSTIV